MNIVMANTRLQVAALRVAENIDKVLEKSEAQALLDELRDAAYAEARCSFCHNDQTQARWLVANPADHERAFICDACIVKAAGLVEQAEAEKRETAK